MKAENTMKTHDDIAPFASLLCQELRTEYVSQYGTVHPELCDRACEVSVKMGKKFAKVDVGSSGRYMVDLETGEIYGIKGYGVVHRGHRYGTLETIQDWNWGQYKAAPRALTFATAPIN